MLPARFIRRTLLVILALSALSLARSQSLEPQLRSSLLGERLKLRNFYIGRELKYDETGALVSPAQRGTWTLDCFLEVTDVKLKKNVLEIKANRLAVIFDHFKKEMRNAIVPGYDTTLVVALPRGATMESVDAQLAKIFLRKDEPLQTMVPSEWQWFLDNPFRTYEGGNLKKETTWAEAAPTGTRQERPASAQPHGPDAVMEDGTYVFRALSQATPIERVRPGFVTAPVATFTPEPVYSERARSLRAEGTSVLFAIVTAEGSVLDLAVQRPLGLGLDEDAIRAVKQWRFEPATKNGKPVPVVINVEVAFHLNR